jgi:hypothetical protein
MPCGASLCRSGGLQLLASVGGRPERRDPALPAAVTRRKPERPRRRPGTSMLDPRPGRQPREPPPLSSSLACSAPLPNALILASNTQPGKPARLPGGGWRDRHGTGRAVCPFSGRFAASDRRKYVSPRCFVRGHPGTETEKEHDEPAPHLTVRFPVLFRSAARDNVRTSRIGSIPAGRLV